MYNKHHKLAIEFNGEGHYMRYAVGRAFLKKETIRNVQKRDKKKKYLCKKHGINLIVIPCYKWNKLSSIQEKRDYLKEKLSLYL